MAETAVRRGLITVAQQEALAALLDLEDPLGSTLPELWHWTQLLNAPAQRDLGPDGHPSNGIPAPPGPGQKRMFAGGRVRTYQLLRTGEACERTTQMLGTVVKEGRTGALTFVKIRHTYMQAGEVCIVEENDIVYRDTGSRLDLTPGTLNHPGPAVEAEPVIRLAVDETFLFRFSALTYNAHRIHYDLNWADHEGYPGLVIHGPLQALLMGELHRRHGDGLVGREFAYRLKAPAVGPQRLTAVPGPHGIEHGSRVLDTCGNVTAAATISAIDKPAHRPV
ncbi:MAG: mesaconyl-C4 CoA hydratase [Streptomyces sp.]|nr:mesaconyl-C4 CoA hydratase [Streptomyces sp.]